MNADTNEIIRTFLLANTVLATAVSNRIFCPRLPENTDLPALGFFTRGGTADPYIPGELHPSVQFDCWSDVGPKEARGLYRILYDALHSIQNETVTVDGTDYMIWSALEEVQGQDLQDVDILQHVVFRVMTMFSFMIKAE